MEEFLKIPKFNPRNSIPVIQTAILIKFTVPPQNIIHPMKYQCGCEILLICKIRYFRITAVNEDRDKIGGIGRAAGGALRVHRALMERPIANAGWLVKKTGVTAGAVNKSLGHLERLGVVREITGRKRNRIFSYKRYVDIQEK